MKLWLKVLTYRNGNKMGWRVWERVEVELKEKERQRDGETATEIESE